MPANEASISAPGPNDRCTGRGMSAVSRLNERVVWKVVATSTSRTWKPARMPATAANIRAPRTIDRRTSGARRRAVIVGPSRGGARSLPVTPASRRYRQPAVRGVGRAAAIGPTTSSSQRAAPLDTTRTPTMSGSALPSPRAKRTVTRRGSPSRIAIVCTAASRPSLMTATRSQVRSTSDRTCDDRKTVVRPSRFNSATVSANASIINGSSPLVGSSRMATFGRAIRAERMPNFRFVPWDRSRSRRARSAGRMSNDPRGAGWCLGREVRRELTQYQR